MFSLHEVLNPSGLTEQPVKRGESSEGIFIKVAFIHWISGSGEGWCQCLGIQALCDISIPSSDSAPHYCRHGSRSCAAGCSFCSDSHKGSLRAAVKPQCRMRLCWFITENTYWEKTYEAHTAYVVLLLLSSRKINSTTCSCAATEAASHSGQDGLIVFIWPALLLCAQWCQLSTMSQLKPQLFESDSLTYKSLTWRHDH